jgi:hypothetical protein
MALAGESVVRHASDLKQIYPMRNEDVHSTSIDGESILLNLTSGRYYSLNIVGAQIWEECTGHHSLHDLLMQICDKFEVTESQAKTTYWT